VKVKPEEVLVGFKHYLKSLLFVRPVKRILRGLLNGFLTRKPYEFRSWSVFMVHNLDVGVILVPVTGDYAYAWRYEEKPSSLFKCLLKVLGHGVFIDVGAYVGFYTVLAGKYGWRVVAFEPNPISLILLRYNIALHDVEDRVVVVDRLLVMFMIMEGSQ
jgi:hypothetical protein